MIESFFQQLALSLENFGSGAYLLVSLIVLLETIVVVGQFIPGSLFLIMVGFLCYMQVFDFAGMATSIVAAHLAGELINYALGRYKGRALFHEDSRFFKPRFLEMAQTRFQASGAKLLVTGQFLGFLRPFISLAAGAAHYPWLRFTIIELIACTIWGVAHIALGFFFGASWQKAVGYMKDFSLVLLIAIPLAIFSGWCIRQLLALSGSLYKVLERLNHAIRQRPWFQRLQAQNPRTFAFVEQRISLSRPWGLGATVGFASAALFFIFAIAILIDVNTQDNWYSFDLSLVNLLAQLRTHGANQFFIVVTALGSAPVVSVVVVLASLACLWSRQHRSLLVLLGSVLLSMLISESLEKIFQRHRPDLALHLVESHGFSFPSGHATVAFALFGSLYYWLWNHPGVLRVRATLAFVLLLAAFLVGFSRVYLGVHYPSDVIGGFCIGFAGVLACGTIAANWQRLADVQSRADIKAGIIMLIYGLSAFGYAHLRPLNVPEVATLQPPKTEPRAAELKQVLPALPRVSTALPGYRYVPINIVLLGDPKPATELLTAAKWHPVKPADFFTRGMTDPVFPAFVEGKPAAITLQQETPNGRRILRLWHTSAHVGDKPLWLGSVVEQLRLKKWGAIDVYHQTPDVDLARDHLADDLAPLNPQRLTNYNKRGLYNWANTFFTYGSVLLIEN